jgi:hypothetical protein
VAVRAGRHVDVRRGSGHDRERDAGGRRPNKLTRTGGGIRCGQVRGARVAVSTQYRVQSRGDRGDSLTTAPIRECVAAAAHGIINLRERAVRS